MTVRARITLHTSDVAWLTIGVIAVGHNIVQVVRGGEQLSEAAARYQRCHPVLTTAVIFVTAAHLRHLLPAWADPWFWLFGAVGTAGKLQPFRHHMQVTVTSNTTRTARPASSSASWAD